MLRRVTLFALVCVLAAVGCGGSRSGVIKIDGPDYQPKRVAVQTLEPPPPPTPSPTPSPTPAPTARPRPIPPPQAASIRSAAGTQNGAPGSFCWSDEVGGPAKCYTYKQPSQPSALRVRSKEKVLLRISATVPPDDEEVRPFRGSRSGYPAQAIRPALQTDLTINLPEGTWSMDLCATWHGRGQPVCWLFKLEVTQ